MANIQKNVRDEETLENHPRASNFPTNYLEWLKLQELSNKGNLGLNRPRNIYQDYHLHQYSLCNSRIQHIAVADDVICVIYGETSLINGETSLVIYLRSQNFIRGRRNE